MNGSKSGIDLAGVLSFMTRLIYPERGEARVWNFTRQVDHDTNLPTTITVNQGEGDVDLMMVSLPTGS